MLAASTEHRGSWLLSTDVKYFISSVSCLISFRRAAFCFSRSSLSCVEKSQHQRSVSRKAQDGRKGEREETGSLLTSTAAGRAISDFFLHVCVHVFACVI